MNISDLTNFKCVICNTHVCYTFYHNLCCLNKCCLIEKTLANNDIFFAVYFLNYKQNKFQLSFTKKCATIINNNLQINNIINYDIDDFFSLTKKQLFKIVELALNTMILQ